MAGAMQCAFHKIPFVLQMVVNAKNAAQIEQVGLLASQLDAARVSFSMLQPTGTRHDKDLYLPAGAWREIEDRIQRLRASLKMPVGTPEGFYRPQPFHVCQPFASEQLHVDVEGRLNLCCQHSGIPSDGRNQDIAGNLHEMSLQEAHGHLLGIIHKAQADKLAAMKKGPLSEWDHFPCNHCMKYFGKPHWTDDFAAGPAARRERWRGAWAPKQSLPVVNEK
jgi:MoaA/NifB/PqqE/SkfB family radical SAM enzyme